MSVDSSCRTVLRIIGLIFPLFLIASLPAEERATEDTETASPFRWQAGVARAVITPETDVWLAGYGTKRVPDGKLHDLWMKALALQDSAGHRAVLITSDFQGVPRSMSDRVFHRLKEELHLDREQVMISFSHNHCGPRLGDDLIDYYPIDPQQERLIADYTDKMVVRMVELVRESIVNLAPAALEQGMGKATFAVNRRNNREADVPEWRKQGKLVGPVDHSVPVLLVTRPDGQHAAILFGYACHPTTLNFLTWCGDYPGFAQIDIEQAFPGATAMFVNTCGGDQNPLPRRSVTLCEEYGHRLATAVKEALKQPLKPVTASLSTAFRYVELPYLKVVDRAELESAAAANHPIRQRWAKRLLRRLDAGEVFADAYPFPLHAWQLGDQTLMIGQGAETVIDYALRYKAEYGPGVWPLGYVDDMIAYIPSRRVWEEGGYEGGWNLYEYGRPALRWQGDIEDRIVQAVDELVNEVRSGHHD